MLLIVSLVIRGLNAYYCKHNFRVIATYRFHKDKGLFKEMTKFAGWNFFGNLGFSLTNLGLNFVLNIFGGVVANAARTIAYQVNNNMRSFVVDIAVAFTPQSMMAYKENIKRFYTLQFFSAKASSAIFLVFVFPMCLFTEQVIQLWLGECPEYSVDFVRGIILYSIVRNLHGPVDIAFKSANKMKAYQICEIIIMILNIPLSYVFLYFGAPLYSIFLIMAIVEVSNLIAILYLAKRQIDFPLLVFMRDVILPTVGVVLVLSALLGVYSYFNIHTNNILQLIIYITVSILVAFILNSFILFNKSERSKILQLITKKA